MTKTEAIQKAIDAMSRAEVENYAYILGRMCENRRVHILQAKDELKRRALGESRMSDTR